MLSATYTIADVKLELENTFDYFDYATDEVFVTVLTRINADVMRRYFNPRIGSFTYIAIAAKDKVGLTEVEEALYWAEVMLTCSFFLQWKVVGVSEQEDSSSSLAGATLSVEGYTYKGGSTSSGGSESSGSIGSGSRSVYYQRALEYFAIAGYNINNLVRGDSVYA